MAHLLHQRSAGCNQVAVVVTIVIHAVQPELLQSPCLCSLLSCHLKPVYIFCTFNRRIHIHVSEYLHVAYLLHQFSAGCDQVAVVITIVVLAIQPELLQSPCSCSFTFMSLETSVHLLHI